MLQSVDMRYGSRKAWGLIRRLGNIPRRPIIQPRVILNQIAHTLLLNGKSPKINCKIQKKRIIREMYKETHYLSKQFDFHERQKAIDAMKNYKAAGLDDICTEQLRHLGPEVRKWIIDLFNYKNKVQKIPKVWRKSKIIAQLKSGKEETDPKNY